MTAQEKKREQWRKYQAAYKAKKKLKEQGLYVETKLTKEEKRAIENAKQRDWRIKHGITKVDTEYKPKYIPVKSGKEVVYIPKKQPPKKEKPKRLPTLNRDLSEMVAVFIPERKMTVYVKKGRNIDKVREKYKIVNNLKM